MILSTVTNTKFTKQVYAGEGDPIEITPTESPEGNLIKNGDFSDGTTGWGIMGTGGIADGCFSVQINEINADTQDWTNILKATGSSITFTTGNTYEVQFDIVSTVDRTIMSAIDAGDRPNSHMENLTANEVKHVSYTFEPILTDSNPFAIYLGRVNDDDIGIAAHTIKIDNVSIVNLTNTGGDTEPTQTPGTEATITPVPSPGGNLLSNGDFSTNTLDKWTKFGNVTVQNQQCVVTIDSMDNVAQDYLASIIDASGSVTYTAGKTYEVQYDIVSTVDRSIFSALDPSRAYKETVKLTANQVEHVSYQFIPTETTTNQFAIYLGKVDEADANVGAHKIVIDNISIVEVSGGTEQPTTTVTPTVTATPTSQPTTEPTAAPSQSPTPDEEEVTPVPAVKGNLLTNGNLEGSMDGWSSYQTGATMTYKPYRVVFDVTENMADWQQSLYQVVSSVETGAKYIVSFDVLSSVDRTVTFGFDGNRDYTSPTIPAGVKTKVTCEVTAATQTFMIYLGTNVGAHTVEISNISLLPKPEDLPDDVNDPLPEAIKSLEGIDFSHGSLLKNGLFTQGSNGLEDWKTYVVEWMTTWDVVKYSKVDNGLKVWITNVGDGAGNIPEDAKFYQTVKLAANQVYTISFDVHSEKARSIQISLDGRNNILSKTIAIQRGETRHVSYNIPAQTTDTTAIFSVLMGSVESREVRENNLTFSNMKIEINGFTELVQKIDDGDFSNGMGTFTSEGKLNVDATTQKSATIMVTEDCGLEEAAVKRSGINLTAGQSVDISFVAGARHNRTIQVVLEDELGNVLKTENCQITTDATKQFFQYTPSQDVKNATLKILVGGNADTIYMDTIRMDATGYAEAVGIDTTAHDITGLDKADAPIISEDTTDDYVGKDITLTYQKNETYNNAIQSILVDGKEVMGTNLCTLRNGEIQLDQSLFTVDSGSDRKTYDIVVKAAWFKDVELKQVIYAENLWSLTWSDEFDGTGSNLDSNNLDLSKWSYQEGNGSDYNVAGWGNNEQQYYTRDNVKVEDGVLKFEAKKESRGGQTYTSGRIWTMADDKVNALFSQTYGKFEAKIKMPAGDGCQGLWPAFWLLPVSDQEYGGWPLSGEIDIMEARGRQPNKVDGTIHFGQPYPNNQSSSKSYVWENGSGSINDYHVYSVEWEPGEIRWYVDGEVYYVENNWYSKSDANPLEFSYPAPFDREFYIILNLAVGGTYDGNLNPDDSALPAEMAVDYVRVYKYNGEYDEPQKPSLGKDEIPAEAKQPNADGDYIVDPEYKHITIINDDTTAQDKTGWNFATLPQFGGSATFTTTVEDGNTLGKIDIANAGAAAHSIQLMQNVPLVKGRYYKISFDAKAAKNRDLSVKFGDIGDDGWSVYGAYSPVLTTNLQHYEYIFQMANDTDITSRIEINLGLNNTSVWIGNVSFKEVESNDVETNGKKTPLDDGNHIYNGSFDLGSSKLVYWNVENLVPNMQDKAFEVETTSNTKETINQQGIQLLQKDTYQLTLNASSSVNRNLDVVMQMRPSLMLNYKFQWIQLMELRKPHLQCQQE